MKRSRSFISNREVPERFQFQDDCWKRKRKSKSSCLLISFIVQVILCASLPLCQSLGIRSSSMHSHSSPSIIYSSKTSFLRPMDTSYEYSSTTYYDNNDLLTMGKGDGKKKRKKKSATPSVTTTEVPAPAPLRVRNDINISVTRQIRWAKMNKEFQKSGTSFRQTNVKRTAYRKALLGTFTMSLSFLIYYYLFFSLK